MKTAYTWTVTEIPDREVAHGSDEGDEQQFGPLVGQADTLPMSNQAKSAAKKRRAAFERLGGFGFGSRRSDSE